MSTPNYNLPTIDAAQPFDLVTDYNTLATAVDEAIKNSSDSASTSLSQLQTTVNQNSASINSIDNNIISWAGEISQLKTDVNQLDDRYGEAIALYEQTNNELAAVEQTANTNATAIDGINTNLAAVQSNVTDLQEATRSQVIYQAQTWDYNDHGLVKLDGNPIEWADNTYTLDAAIPSWANWIDVYFTAQSTGSSFFNEGASSTSDTTIFISPLIVQTFPTKIAKKETSSSAIVVGAITDFCVSMPPMMGTNPNGYQTMTFGAIPFRITGTQLTQRGLSADSNNTQFKNTYSSVQFTFNNIVPTVNNYSDTASIYKIVARA